MKISISIDKRALNDLIDNVRDLRRDLNTQFNKKARQKVARQLIKPALQKNIPKKSGRGAASVTDQDLGQDRSVVGHDKDKTKTEDGKHSYLDIVFYGVRKGYWIYPKRPGGVLRFEIGDKVIYAKKVYIPPRPGNKFIDRTVIDLRQDKRAIGEFVLQELSKNKFINIK